MLFFSSCSNYDRMFTKLRSFYHRHQAFGMILLLFFTFRLLALLLFRPGGLIDDYSDFAFYYAWGQLIPQGYRMYETLWATYPPLFPALMLPAFELSSRIPPWVDPRLFFHLIFGLELLIFESGNLILIYRLAQKLEGRGTAKDSENTEELQSAIRNPQSAINHPVILYALLFTPVYMLLGWFEAMPLFFLLLGLDLLISGRRWGWMGSALAAALGFLLKLMPAVLVPVGVRWLGGKLSWEALRKEWFNPKAPGNLLRPFFYVLVFGALVVGLGYVLIKGNLALGLSSFRINDIRAPWQSVWALLDGYYGFGVAPVDMRNLGGLARNYWESSLPWGWISVGFAAVYLWFYTRRYDWTQPRTPVALTATSLIWLLLYNKGWSPQFLVMILPFIVLLMPNLYGVALATALGLLNFLESIVYLVMLPDQRWLLVATVLIRTALLLLLMVEFLGQIWPVAQMGQRIRRAGVLVAWGIMIVSLLGAVIAWPRVAQAYQARRLAEHPCRAAIEYLRNAPVAPDALIVSDQIDIWRDFYPWLRDRYQMRIIDSYDPQDRPKPEVVAERLDDFVGNQEFWWIERPQSSSQAGLYFARSDVHTLERQRLGDCTVARIIRLDEPPLAVAEAAGSQITLRQINFDRAQVGADFHLMLYWQADEKVRRAIRCSPTCSTRPANWWRNRTTYR
jgi:hypothetical protein